MQKGIMQLTGCILHNLRDLKSDSDIYKDTTNSLYILESIQY